NIHDARFELTDVEFGRRAGSRERRGREAERLEPSDGFELLFLTPCLVIEGPAKSNVADAKRRVEIIVWTNREKEKPTHFISIPLTVPHIRDRVSLFKSSVLDSCRRERGICEDVFQLPEKFHLTVGVLRIFSEEEEFASLPSYCCSYCIYTYIGEGKAVNIHDARFELTDVEFGRRAGSRERRGREAERLEPSDGEGRIKKGIERDTECHLWLPSRGIEGDVVIEGPAKSNVADAKRRVEIIVWTNREKEKPTHFISIPLTVPHIRDRVSLFKSSVLDSCRRERGICEDVFQLPEKFHLTVGVLRIFSEEEEEKAKSSGEGSYCNGQVNKIENLLCSYF
ncbi:Activating signal cointegrator 1 complex subunit 1, partial [Geodia barretti]